MPYRVGFDVGGTFTDFVLQSPSGELLAAKRLTTYPDPSEACLAGLDELIAQGSVPWTDVAQVIHGTTLGSNIVIERKARGVGLLTTRGFRDVLVIGREKRYQIYDLQIEKPAPLIPRRLIGEVTERILADGSVRTPLDEADARRAIRELAGHGVTRLAICLRHSYVNGEHERRLAAIVPAMRGVLGLGLPEGAALEIYPDRDGFARVLVKAFGVERPRARDLAG